MEGGYDDENPLMMEEGGIYEMDGILVNSDSVITIVDNIPEAQPLEKEESKEEPKLFLCDFCIKPFKNKRTLNNHVKIFHIDTKTFVCTLCGKVFNSSNGLSKHMNCHNQESSYQCGLCPKKYKHSHGLKRHLKKGHLETEVKDTKCNHCEFHGSLSAVESHVRRNHMKNVFTCPDPNCDYKTNRSDVLKTHQKTHDQGRQKKRKPKEPKEKFLARQTAAQIINNILTNVFEQICLQKEKRIDLTAMPSQLRPILLPTTSHKPSPTYGPQGDSTPISPFDAVQFDGVVRPHPNVQTQLPVKEFSHGGGSQVSHENENGFSYIIERANSYLDEVAYVYGDGSSTYGSFVSQLKEFKVGALTKQELERSVRILFKGNERLMEGFLSFIL